MASPRQAAAEESAWGSSNKKEKKKTSDEMTPAEKRVRAACVCACASAWHVVHVHVACGMWCVRAVLSTATRFAATLCTQAASLTALRSPVSPAATLLVRG